MNQSWVTQSSSWAASLCGSVTRHRQLPGGAALVLSTKPLLTFSPHLNPSCKVQWAGTYRMLPFKKLVEEKNPRKQKDGRTVEMSQSHPSISLRKQACGYSSITWLSTKSGSEDQQERKDTRKRLFVFFSPVILKRFYSYPKLEHLCKYNPVFFSS